MKYTITGWIVAFYCFQAMIAYSQDEGKTQQGFSLNQAVGFALENNASVKNAKLDIYGAKKKVWETTAIGLPQIGAKASLTYMLTVPSSIQQFSSFSNLPVFMYGVSKTLYGLTGGQFDTIPNPGSPEESNENDLKMSTTVDFTVSQLIFSGGYIVGLQTSKTFRNITDLSLRKSENDVKESVTNAYFMNLIMAENARILDSTYSNMEKIIFEFSEMNKQGFIEETDVDQLKITAGTIKNALDMIKRQQEVILKLLKYNMGIPGDQEIILTDQLDVLIQNINDGQLLSQSFSMENNVDYNLLATQEKMQLLNVKYNKSQFLPDLVAFYNHQEQLNDKAFSFTPPDMIGLTLNVPIFSSGMKLARVSQAKVQYEKARNQKEQLSQGLLLGFDEARSSLNTAKDKYETQKQNMEMAKKIADRSLIKYREGIISSLELTQAQNQYLTAQSTYYTTLIELIQAKTKLEKLVTPVK